MSDRESAVQGPSNISQNVVFVDTETTGLDPDRHEIWEVACIHWGRAWRPTKERDPNGTGFKTEEYGTWLEKTWRLPVDLGRADPMALKISRYHERGSSTAFMSSLTNFARDFAKLTRGKHLVGAVISFDEERLRKLLRANGACPEWHYHLIDVEALAVGYLAEKGVSLALPWDSDELSKHLGIAPDTSRHEALYDAQWAKQIFDAVMIDA